MAKIEIKNIKKSFGQVQALKGINLEIKDKEFFVLFGPAGAGKTTILNCIAGIVMPDEGNICFDDKDMNLVDTAHRNIAMVFENYALYPHMTVFDNIASPMRSRLYKKDEETIKKKVYDVAKVMKMENLLDRLPNQLSNGQKQRVAMGRALVREPNVFLMDEPLAHLDAKLRNAMRTEFKEIQNNFGTTSIYVTHDFMEAMSLGDRIAIVKEGRIVQIGTGDRIYYMPCNRYVAQLMGDPEINIIRGTLASKDGIFSLDVEDLKQKFILPFDENFYNKIRPYDGQQIELGLRPQNISYSFDKKEGYFKSTIYSYESIGNKSVITTDNGELQLRMIAPNGLTVKIDQEIYISLKLDYSIAFHPDTGEYISRYNESSFDFNETEQEELK